MARRISPEYILPLRFTLHVPADTSIQFSVLDFPYGQALNDFTRRLENIYQHQHGTKLPFEFYPPDRQLNDAVLTLAPGLIQGFESPKNPALKRMVAFTRFENGRAEDFPTLEDLTSLIRIWLERWAMQPAIQDLLEGDSKAAWQTLMDALDGSPEADWRHGITPDRLAADPGGEKGLAFLALPALLTALLHDRTQIIERSQGAFPITWRRANDGGKDGLHLVSQPMSYRDDYFAYRLDFSVETQAGYGGGWIFARLGIQRYIGERYRSGDPKRAISILVGHNREHFTGGWDTDTTLIRLPVKSRGKTWDWASGVGGLLDDFAMRKLESPETILSAPQHYGSYGGDVEGDEYYVVYAEGRTFSDKSVRGRQHQTKTGVRLHESSQIMDGVLSLLGGWLEKSAPFQKDIQNPANTLALRDYDHVAKRNKKMPAKQASWRAALEASLANSDATHAHLVVLYRRPQFRQWAQAQIDETLMGVGGGDAPLMTVTFIPMPSMLYTPLESNPEDSETQFLPNWQKPRGFPERRRKQMHDSYLKKRQEWRDFLSNLHWQPNARRLLLIDSTGERDQKLSSDQKIKGAVRDACHRENVLSQFIVGDALKPDPREAHKADLDGGSAGRLKNAVLDLVVRQQGILYAPPREIYEWAAQLDAETASQLDVIALCRVERNQPRNFRTVLAVRLRASGEVDVMLPDDSQWTPYVLAAHKLGIMYSQQRVPVAKESASSRLRLGHKEMLDFAHAILTKQLERPTIAVIEAAGWRASGGTDRQNDCWTQLTNPNLSRYRDVLRFDAQRSYDRAAPALDNLLGVVRLRMDDETPQYITAEDWKTDALLDDIRHLTGYVDLVAPDLLHYFSVARLPETQKRQTNKHFQYAFRADVPENLRHELAVKHPQLIELVPFFVHPRYQSDEGQRQLCRCVHFLRNSPAFTMGEITLPYPMHLGEKLINDQLVILGADD